MMRLRREMVMEIDTSCRRWTSGLRTGQKILPCHRQESLPQSFHQRPPFLRHHQRDRLTGNNVFFTHTNTVRESQWGQISAMNIAHLIIQSKCCRWYLVSSIPLYSPVSRAPLSHPHLSPPLYLSLYHARYSDALFPSCHFSASASTPCLLP